MSTPTRAVEVITPGQAVLAQPGTFNERQMRVLKAVLCKEATDTEITLLGEVSRATNADPFQGDVVMVIYNKDRPDKRTVSFIFSTKWADKRATKAGTHAGIDIYYRTREGQWVDVWDNQEMPTHGKAVAKRVIRNGDGTYAGISEETTIVTYKSLYRNTDFWRDDPLNQFTVGLRRRALKKLDVVPDLGGLSARIGDAGEDYRIVEGQALATEPAFLGDNAPERTFESLLNLMDAANLTNEDLNCVLTRPGEIPINAKNFEPRLKRYFAANGDMGVLDIIAQATAARAGVDAETGEINESPILPEATNSDIPLGALQEQSTAGPIGMLPGDVDAEWGKIPKLLVAAGGLKPADLTPILGGFTKPQFAAWLTAQEGRSAQALVEAVVEQGSEA